MTRAAAGMIYCLPRRAALAFARILGAAAYYVIWRQRDRIFENLSAAYGTAKTEAEFRRIGREVMQNAAETAVEVLQFPKLDREKINRFVDSREALAVYHGLLKEGKGVLSITAHLGNWELLAGVVIRNGFSACVIGRRIYYEPYNDWIIALRRALGIETIYRDEPMRRVVRALKANRIVGLLPDQDMDSLPGIFVDFFGWPAYTSIAPVKLSLMTGAPIVVSFLIREPGDRYRLVVEEVIRPEMKTGREDALRKYTEQWMGDFERMILRYPGQWAWMHNRWKTRKKSEELRIKSEELRIKSKEQKVTI